MQLFLLISVAVIVLGFLVKASVILFAQKVDGVNLATSSKIKSHKVFVVKTANSAKYFFNSKEYYLPLTLACLVLAYKLLTNA